MTPTDRMQCEFARLAGDADARARFVRDPDAESPALAGLPPVAVARFAEGVLGKRYREVRALLPHSASAPGFRRAFDAYAARSPIGGHDRHRADAIAFARALGTPQARTERRALEAPAGGRARAAFALVRRRIERWWRARAANPRSAG